MPGAGKSTVGVLLSKRLAMNFIDTDILIQIQEGQTLKQILQKRGVASLRDIEGQIIEDLNPDNTVVATGGSAIYNPNAMNNLGNLGPVIYLQVSNAVLNTRLGNLTERGVAAPPTISLKELADERIPLYEYFASHHLDCSNRDAEGVVEAIVRIYTDLEHGQ
jgi:shikimate kinase